MIDVQKFLADVQRIIKHDRADNGGLYDGYRASKKIAAHFVSCNPGLSALPDSIAEYWYNTKIVISAKPETEPSEESIEWLADVFEILQGCTPEKSHLTKKDWTELKDIINAEAEELPIDVLTELMSSIVSSGVL